MYSSLAAAGEERLTTCVGVGYVPIDQRSTE